MSEVNDKPSRLVRALGVFGDLFELNVLFVLSCIPVITIGAALTSLYTVTLRMVRHEDGSIRKQYFSAFKSNFKRATGYWLLFLAASFVIWVEMIYALNFEGTMPQFYMVFIIVELVFLSMVLAFLFPLTARYENSFWGTIRNSFLLSVSNMGSWIKIALAWGVPLGVTIYRPFIFFYTWYLWLFIIFGLIAWGTAHTVNKVFKRIEKKKPAEESSEEE
ncbi:MAG: DUF624 domain-containing protein [Lachnospiraceae bacterium]|nr:DUF624 domain-containing protein [Lachnospiraceae bacterium]